MKLTTTIKISITNHTNVPENLAVGTVLSPQDIQSSFTCTKNY